MWAAWSKWIWVAILGALLAYELVGVLRGRDLGVVTLTRLTVAYAPWWVTLPFLGWLFTHFVVRYWRK